METTRNYHHWKANEIKTIEATYKTRSDAQIAAEFNTTISAVKALRRRMGLYRQLRERDGGKPNHKWTTEEIKYLVDTFPNYPDSHYAQKFGISKSAVRIYRFKLKLARLKMPTQEVGKRRTKWAELRKVFSSLQNPGLSLDQMDEILKILGRSDTKEEEGKGIIYLDKKRAS